MQQELESNSDFSERTEVLCRKIGVKISDLPPEIGVSPSMFHAYRSGKQPITARVWRKLEAAERTAGLNPTEPELQSSTLREEVPPYRFTAHESPKATAPTTEERLGRLEGLLERIAVALERMIEKNGGGHE